jgi:hypothetical protein
MKIRDDELPRTREEVTAWALAFSDGFSWKNVDSNVDNIVIGVNLLLKWVCNDLVTTCPDLISLYYLDSSYGVIGTSIQVAGISVMGGMVPCKRVVLHAVHTGTPMQIINHDKYTCTSQFESENYLADLGLFY